MWVFKSIGRVLSSSFRLGQVGMGFGRTAGAGLAVALWLAAPAAGTASVFLPGEFDTDDTGAATYSIPIAAPPGTAGVVPKLSLEYNSRGSNGVVGVGWHLSGLSQISRCGKTLDADGARGAVAYDANDRFCMDGQRLIAVNGVYGANLTEYRTAAESFTKIVSYGQTGSGPASFTAWTKDGRILEFGWPVDGKIEAVGRTEIRVWALNKIKDRSGNYVAMIYGKDTGTNGTGDFWPEQIIYTGNDGVGLTPYNRVEFAYETRPDPITSYQGGVAVKQLKRLTNIKTFAMPQAGGTAELVSDYRLAYSASPTTGRSRLNSVTLCGSNGALCLPPTTFTWEDGAKTLTQTVSAADASLRDITPSSTLGKRFFPLDINGDGRGDLAVNDGGNNTIFFKSNGSTLAYTAGTNVTSSPPFPCRLAPDRSGKVFDGPCLWGDWNRDGLPDAVYDTMSGYISKFYSTLEKQIFIKNGAYSHTPATEDQRFFVGDFDGNGTSDIIIRDKDGYFARFGMWDGNISYDPGRGSCDEWGNCSGGYNSGVASDQTIGQYCDESGCVPTTTLPPGNELLPRRDDRFWVTDVNGDGIADIVVRRSNGTLNNHSGGANIVGSTSTIGTDALPVNHQRYFPMDVNGDGRGDMVIRHPDGTLYVYLSNGTNWVLEGTVQTETAPGAGDGFTDTVSAADKRWFVMDVNGDGLQDMVVPVSGNRLRIFFSNGKTFTAGGWVTDTSQNPIAWGLSGTPEDQVGRRWFIMDLNGDGRADLVHRANDGVLRHLISNGTNLVFETQQGVGLADATWATTGDRYFLLDVTGDGRVDLVMRESLGATGVLHTWAPSGAVPDRIKAIRGSLGNEIQIGYRHLTDTSTHAVTQKPFYERHATPNIFPQIDIRNGMLVVSETKSSNGLGGWFHTTYTYAGARAHSQSGSFAGFRTITARNESTSIEETKTYNHEWGGLLEKTEMAYVPDNVMVGGVLVNKVLGSRATHAYGATNYGGGRTFIYPTSTVRETFEMTGALKGKLFAYESMTWNGYDAYGNATQTTSVLQARDDAAVADQLTTVTTQAWLNDVNDGAKPNDVTKWLIGKVLTATVTRTLNGASLTRKSGFSYDANGRVIQEAVEPDQPAFKVATDYTFTTHGNPWTKTVRGATTADDRSTTYTYDTRGRFVVRTQDPLGYVEATDTLYDHRFGLPTDITDVNGMRVVAVYDGLGRKTSETAKPTGGYSPAPADLVSTQAHNFCTGLAGATGITEPCPSTVPNLAYRVVITAPGKPTIWTYRDVLDRDVLVEVQQAFEPTAATPRKIIARRIEHNNNGQVIKAYKPYFSDASPGAYMSQTYDVWGRPLTETAPDGGVTTHVYEGRRYIVRNALNHPRTIVKGVENRVLTATDALNGTTTFQYNAFGSVTRTIDAKGVVTDQAFDIRGRRTQVSDPNSGTWNYTYDLFGQLITQTDAKSQLTTFAYDKLGRPLSKQNASGIKTEWNYDTATRTSGTWKRMLGSVTMKDVSVNPSATPYLSRLYNYDAFGRIGATYEFLDGANYAWDRTYDSSGRLETLTYPGGFGIRHVYTDHGYLKQIQNKDVAATAYWTANTVSAEGQITQFTQGNGTTTGAVTTRQYDASARLTRVDTLRGTSRVQEAAFNWDQAGNLTNRTDWMVARGENFTYDALNRLVSINMTGPGGIPPNRSFAYDAVGNFTTKSNGALGLDTGLPAQLTATYEYVAGTHRLTRLKNAAGTVIDDFAYDLNGNVTGTSGTQTTPTDKMYRSYTWTAENMPRRVTRGNSWEEFDYGPENQRWKQWEWNGTTSTWTYYSVDPATGALMESWIPQGQDWRHRRYIRAGGELVAISVGGPNIPANDEVQYVHNDHLGSIAAMTNLAAAGPSTGWLKLYSFDAWGKRRQGDGANAWSDDPSENAPGSAGTERGYTGHEQLASGITHMNGRVYDPLVGRFLSPDPFIQDASDTQAFNRYSYVGNNPLAYTDPSGYLKIGKLFKKLKKVIPAAVFGIAGLKPVAKLFIKVPILRAIHSMAMSFIPVVGVYVAAAYNMYLNALSGMSIGDVFKNGLISFAAAYAGSALSPMSQLASGAVLGCASSVVNGGSCAMGAVSGALSAAASYFTNTGEFGVDLMLKSLVGGAIAKLNGGKFENGAMMAAMAYVASVAARGAFARSEPSTGVAGGNSRSSGAGAYDDTDDEFLDDEQVPKWRSGYQYPVGSAAENATSAYNFARTNGVLSASRWLAEKFLGEWDYSNPSQYGYRSGSRVGLPVSMNNLGNYNYGFVMGAVFGAENAFDVARTFNYYRGIDDNSAAENVDRFHIGQGTRDGEAFARGMGWR